MTPLLPIAILDAISAHLALLDAEGRIVAVNEAWRRFALESGHPWPPAGVGDAYLAVCDGAGGAGAAGAAEVAAGIREVLAGDREGFVHEYSCRTAGGERWFVVRAVRMADTAPVQVVVSHEEVTALVQARTRAEQREAWYRSVLEHARDIITVVGSDGMVRYQSPAMRTILGYDPHSLRGTDPFAIIHPEDRPAVEAALRAAGRGRQEAIRVEYRCRHEQGHWCWLESTGMAYTSPEGPAVVVHSRDVTERRRTEEKVRRAERLEVAGGLAAGIAHDFNNVLTTIHGYAELLAQELGEGDARRELVDEILAGSTRAARLTAKLLALGRRQLLRPRELDLVELCRACTPQLQAEAGPGVACVTAAYTPEGQVSVDREQLLGVLRELVANAREAMPHGGTVRVSVRDFPVAEGAPGVPSYVQPGDYVGVTVEDTGVGMEPAVLARAFDPFFTTRQGGEASGLGLSAALGVARQSGGHLWGESRPGAGSRFVLLLPRVPLAVEAAPPPVAPPAAGCGPCAVLLAEDEEEVRRLTRRVLEREGYTVLEARDGVEALGVFEAEGERIRLLVTDLTMPRMGGAELAERLRQLRPDLPVVFVSGYAEAAPATGGSSRAVFLAKPFEPAELVRQVGGMLEGQGVGVGD